MSTDAAGGTAPRGVAAWPRCRPERELGRSGVGKSLDDTPPERPLEVAVDV
jgi:hypothetical protein